MFNNRGTISKIVVMTTTNLNILLPYLFNLVVHYGLGHKLRKLNTIPKVVKSKMFF